MDSIGGIYVEDDQAEGPAVEKYPHNVLEGFANGCLLDLRVRWAHEYLKSPVFANVVTDTFGAYRAGDLNEEELANLPSLIAAMALETANELLQLSSEEGFVTPLPKGTDIDQVLRDQAGRTARFQVLQQILAQKVGEEEADKIVSIGAIGGLGLVGRNGH